MTLFDQIKTDVTRAQKERNSGLLNVLRLLVSELKYKEIDSAGNLTDDLVVGVLQKEAKKRQESIDIYTKVGDSTRADAERYELEAINSYLPKMMTETEVEAEVDKIANTSSLRGGQLVGVAMGKLRGKADGGLVAKIVNQKYGK
ncbi:hypothetical protein A3A84_03770 [Candidatus Collierbacteria bacterium RIFCSPLOWO2_01_FULL_50_23]|uniref:Glutamyl-tRNA amidotransferase n=2 Tax=Candidatus Collieribacteriota TaxID=1752725 RepID=A0A1F5ESP5_9BACT|nr:MAG: hypothetical protein A3D09_01460 [Candidatus Collierbacteria bacterium RIFCSPHIGHO2_02_FULL_49_10]OGD71307.1 MAG: hypothetical protein A2703_03350 [Candidatus Collierbacteria bacterium RIFCSPHIGHO2_01_FULL_50_25]OGD75288.1 MAG: hypothetical protein A3A84_03770 [Candidatus Collierbacteria bacterium RIFCSPLOWO2_01_FULL_50_23]